MITKYELAVMKAQANSGGNFMYDEAMRLICEVEELTDVANNAADEIDALRRTVDLHAQENEELRKNLDVELDLNTHLVRRIEELRAALREIDGIVNWRESIPFTDLHRIARAALGEVSASTPAKPAAAQS